MENLDPRKNPRIYNWQRFNLDDGNPKSLGNGWKSPNLHPFTTGSLVFQDIKIRKKSDGKKKEFSLGSPIKNRTFNDVDSSRVCHDVSRIFS